MKSKINKYHIAGLFLVIIIILLFSCSSTKKSDTKKITDTASALVGDFIIVPDLIGKTEAEARTLIESQGLQIQVIGEEFNSFVPIGKISSQSPATNSTAIKGTKVTIVISKGTGKK